MFWIILAAVAGAFVLLALAFIVFAIWATQPTTVRGDALSRIDGLDGLDSRRGDEL